jgi:hypothetical protein
MQQTLAGEDRAGWAGLAAFLTAFLFAIASGLLIAPMVALCAMIAMPIHRQAWAFREPPWALVPAGVFLAWLGLSFLWSPYDDPQQLPKTLLGIPLYVVFVYRINQLGICWRRRMESALLFTVIGIGLFMFSEAMTDGVVTRGFKTTVEDIGLVDQRTISILVNKSLGHGTVPFLLLAGPAALIAWREGGPLIGGVIMVTATIAAFSFDTEVNAAGLILGSIAATVTYFWPRMTLAVLFGAVAGAFIVIPLILPGIIGALPEGLTAALPSSWIMRLEIWTFTGERVREALWFGHGLDAARIISGESQIMVMVDGTLTEHSFELLPQHPHNAALQVWLETGIVGTVLLAFSLVAIGARVAMAPRLTKIQAIGVAWVFTVYVCLIFFSYGVWQEWHQGAVALAATAVFFLGVGHQQDG